MAPYEQQIAQLTQRMMNLENVVPNTLSIVDPLVSRIDELRKLITSFKKALVALTSTPATMEAQFQSLIRPECLEPTEHSAPLPQPPTHTPDLPTP